MRTIELLLGGTIVVSTFVDIFQSVKTTPKSRPRRHKPGLQEEALRPHTHA
jgi:hypothetical protein